MNILEHRYSLNNIQEKAVINVYRSVSITIHFCYIFAVIMLHEPTFEGAFFQEWEIHCLCRSLCFHNDEIKIHFINESEASFGSRGDVREEGGQMGIEDKILKRGQMTQNIIHSNNIQIALK
ncbi:hypothetical protein ACJX0J_034373 [Zea mays]